jgi:hypothetical protein
MSLLTYSTEEGVYGDTDLKTLYVYREMPMTAA